MRVNGPGRTLDVSAASGQGAEKSGHPQPVPLSKNAHATIEAARGWIKTKNPNYWRRDMEREAMVRSWERRIRTSAVRK